MKKSLQAIHRRLSRALPPDPELQDMLTGLAEKVERLTGQLADAKGRVRNLVDERSSTALQMATLLMRLDHIQNAAYPGGTGVQTMTRQEMRQIHGWATGKAWTRELEADLTRSPFEIARARVKALEEALKPFADFAVVVETHGLGQESQIFMITVGGGDLVRSFNWSDFARADRVLGCE